MLTLENIEITAINSEGRGIGRSNKFEKVLFIKQAALGDIVSVKITKEEKNFAIAEVVEVVKPSEFHTQPSCKHYGICGGCNLQHMAYNGQLIAKERQVNDAFKKIAKLQELNILPIIPSDNTFQYRNKMDFEFSDLSWIVNETEEKLNVKKLDRRVLGLHIEGRFDRVLDIEECLLMPEKINKIRNYIRDFCKKSNASFYNPKTKTGVMRNVIFRTNSEGKIMVIIIFATSPGVLQAQLCMGLKKDFPEITSLFWGVNKKEMDAIEDTKLFAFIGEDFFEETLAGMKFEISAKSFAQVNFKTASKMISKVLEIGGFKGDDIVYDLYSGIGSFTIPISKKVKQVIGVEISKSAIKDAKESAILNNSSNIKFIKGDVAEVINEDLVIENGKARIWVIDPPRAGISNKVIEKIIEFLPERIIYVSCNPSTLARDFAKLQSNYKLALAQPIDMFPQTNHVETIAIIERI